MKLSKLLKWLNMQTHLIEKGKGDPEVMIVVTEASWYPMEILELDFNKENNRIYLRTYETK